MKQWTINNLMLVKRKMEGGREGGEARRTKLPAAELLLPRRRCWQLLLFRSRRRLSHVSWTDSQNQQKTLETTWARRGIRRRLLKNSGRRKGVQASWNIDTKLRQRRSCCGTKAINMILKKCIPYYAVILTFLHCSHIAYHTYICT